jgi:hypothetical protein
MRGATGDDGRRRCAFVASRGLAYTRRVESAPPGDGRRALAMAMAIGLLAAGCSESAAQRCENGSYCPEGTRCSSGAFCLVEEASCGDFEPNAPCVGAGDAGARFCASGGCQDGVQVSGRLTVSGGGAIEGATVAAVDREWMQPVATDSLGGFALDAVPNDTDLVLRLEGNDARPSLLTRRLALGSANYAMNGDATVPLRLPTRAELEKWAVLRTPGPDPSRGAVGVQIGRQPGNQIEGATATLAGPTDRDPLYFRGNDAAASAVDTGSGNSTVVFVELEPGTYTLTADHENAVECVGAGDDRPDPVVVDVRAGELTAAGWIICRQ